MTKAAAEQVLPKALVQTIGKSAGARNFTWYTLNKQVDQELQYAPKADVKGGVFPANAIKVKAQSDGDVRTLTHPREQFNYRVSIAALQPDTAYAYRVGNEKTGWSPVYDFKTAKFTGDYSFLFFGDAQVGASSSLEEDKKGWIDTLNVGMAKYPNTELLFSGGDQVESAPNEDEYDAFLAPEQLRSLPLVPIIGNHDVWSKAFENHFTLPGLDKNYGGGCATYGGCRPGDTDFSSGNYYFEYKDTLFVILNSNANSPKDIAEHTAFLEKASQAHPNAKWKVVGFHHSIYSAATHAIDAGDTPIIEAMRGGKYNVEKMKDASLTNAISKFGYDFVLMGHDHNYTRTFLLNKDGQKSNPAEKEGQTEITAKQGDVLYITGNSSSGSKFYSKKLRPAGDNESKGRDGKLLPVAPYASVINQETLRNYT
ncbi:MAG: metallophosphoesterase family protein, partial [Microbacteriaceae bacterium]|nr:metallophosphoesterase family protein [Microbacteriaceae bacterium]